MPRVSTQKAPDTYNRTSYAKYSSTSRRVSHDRHLGSELHTNLNAATPANPYDILGFSDYGSTIDGATRVTALGSEEITHYDFSSASGWSGTGWVVSGGVATGTATTDGIIRQDLSLTVGDYYLVEYKINSISGGGLYTRWAVTGFNGTTNSAPGVYRDIFVVDAGMASPGRIELRPSASITAVVDYFSVKRISTAGAEDTGPIGSGRLVDMIPQGSALSSSTMVNSGGAPYDTFDGATATGFHVINDTDSAQAGTVDEISFVNGKYYVITFSLSLASGSLPRYAPRPSLGAGDVGGDGFISASSGANTHVFRCNQTTTGVVSWDNNASATEYTISSFSIKELLVLGSDLVTAGDFTQAAAKNVSNCVNGDYDTFANATPTGFDAIKSTAGTKEAGTADEISFVSGQKYAVSFDLVLNGGAAPVYVPRTTLTGVDVSDEGDQTASAGHNRFIFTANQTTTGTLVFRNSTDTDYEITNLHVCDANTDWAVTDDSWMVIDNVAYCDGSQASESIIQQNNILAVGEGAHLVKYTVSNYSAGTVRLSVNTQFSTSVSANGTYSFLTYTASGDRDIKIRANSDFIGEIDNVSVHKLTWTRTLSKSDNYQGTQYCLPVDEFDFVVPTTYAAESINLQDFSGDWGGTAGFTSANLDGTGDNIFRGDNTSNGSGAALYASSEDTPTNGARFYVDLQSAPFSVVAGNTYKLTFDCRHIGSGQRWAAYLSVSNDGTTNLVTLIQTADTTYSSKEYYWVHDANYRWLIFKEHHGDNDGGVYVDNISIKQVN